MIRLPDHYYTTQVLDGNPDAKGVYWPAPNFSQGEDIVMTLFLKVDDQPVTSDKYEVSVIIKKNPYANNVLWRCKEGDYLILNYKDVPGNMQIWMPADVSAQFLPGAYYLAVELKERLGTGPEVKDRTIVPFQSIFDIVLTAASPNPKLSPSQVTEVSYDIESGVTTITMTGVEPTVPPSVDTSKPSGLMMTPTPQTPSEGD